MNDITLAESVSSLPPHGILLIEDIDCAFPSRGQDEERKLDEKSSHITMSGLLNVLDGIGSGNVVPCLASARANNLTTQHI